MDAVTKALLDAIEAFGVAVTYTRGPDGQYRVTGVHSQTAETYVVTAPDLYTALCELAQAVGFDLEDGYRQPLPRATGSSRRR